MTRHKPQLRPTTAQDRSDCSAFLTRLTRLDPDALVRARASGGQVVLWASTLRVLVRHHFGATLDASDVTVSARQLFEALTGDMSALLVARDADWRAGLPPETGWSLIDVVPAQVLRRLAGSAARAVRTAVDPRAAGSRMLDQEALRVSASGVEVAVPMRVVTALERMGFLGAAQPEGDGAQPEDVVRFAATPAWTRAAARHGTVYLRRPGAGPSFA